MIYINITNSFKTRAKTGIQRVVRKLSERLVRRADVVLLVRVGADFHRVSQGNELQAFLNAEDFIPQHNFDHEKIHPGDIYFDIDASWGDAGEHEEIWRKIKSLGCIMVKMHYDAVPILYPEFSSENTVYRYIENFSSALKLFDHWVCISETVRRDFLEIARKTDCGQPDTSVFPLGSDIQMNVDHDMPVFSDRISNLSDKKLIIAVGTVEPRKNYELILDSFELLISDSAFNNLHLVLVGKPGWNNTKTIQRIENHPLQGQRIHWYKDASDIELTALYRHAIACLCMSHYEGYGLPVVEALANGAHVICTENSAMAEVAQGHADTVAPDPHAVVQALKALLAKENRLSSSAYIPTSWDQSCNALMNILDGIQEPRVRDVQIRQAVYISNRPENLAASILSLDKLPFIEEVVVLTSDARAAEMRALQEKSNIPMVVVMESEIGLSVLPDDHQERNTTLRRVLYKSDYVHSYFLAFDDDCHAIKSIGSEEFLSNGRQSAYSFFENGNQWLGSFPQPTSFDIGIWRTSAYLERAGYRCHLYNSHQPQLIDKELAVRILNRTEGLGLDEWSVYFNIAMHLYPQSFNRQNYVTAGWPADFEAWLPDLSPQKLIFYNDPPIDKLLPAENWLKDLQDSKLLYAPILENRPTLTLASHSLKFARETVHCHKGASLFIPLKTDAIISKISYQFLDCNVSFENKDIPNILHVPVGNEVNEFDVVVSVDSRGISYFAKMRVIVHSLKEIRFD